MRPGPRRALYFGGGVCAREKRPPGGPGRRRPLPPAHRLDRRADVGLVGRRGREDVLDERLPDGQQAGELGLDLLVAARGGEGATTGGREGEGEEGRERPHNSRRAQQEASSGSSSGAAAATKQQRRSSSSNAAAQRSRKRGAAAASKAGRSVRQRARPVSSRLLERGATITLACSSTLKLAHVKSGST